MPFYVQIKNDHYLEKYKHIINDKFDCKYKIFDCKDKILNYKN